MTRAIPHFEILETRRLLALLGIELEDSYPTISTNPGGPQALTYLYVPTTGTFKVDTTPLNYQESEDDPQVFVFGPSSFTLEFTTTNTGSFLGGVAGDDFVLTGTISGGGPSGVLLTGEMKQFGFEDNPPGGSTTHLFDFRLSVTGGLLASKFSGKDIGLSLFSEASTFEGDFKSDFSGNAKATLGPIPEPDEEVELSSISGVKYRDLTGDGINAGDTPLGGFTINLYQDNGTTPGVLDGLDTFVTSDVTDAGTGAYSFADLEPGSYIVQEVVPAGYTQSAPVGDIHVVLLPDVETHVTGKDFANFENIDLRGKKFKDITGDGISGDDLPLQGTTIQLFKNDVLVDSTQTGADGTYAFTNLGPGKYSVQEVVPSGWYQTDGLGGHTIAVAQEDVGDLNFANARLTEISGKKVRDKTGNGVSADDTALGGTTINLYRDVDNDGELTAADGGAIRSTTTAALTGAYSFAGLELGTYFVQEVVPADYVQTGPASPGYFKVITTSNGDSAGFDFANFKKIKLSGKKFKDVDGLGFGADDLALGGTTINLFKNGGVVPVASTTTAADGTYCFENLGPGSYTVKEVVPAGWYQTGGPVTGYAVDPATGDVTGLDFANARFTKITGKKVKDRTGNGLSADDTALGGVKIKLYNDVNGDGKLTGADGAAIDWTTTAYGTGEYCFDGLKPGKYLVQEVVPDGYVRTAPQCEDYYAVTTTSCDDSYGNDFANFDKKDCDCVSVTCISYIINGTKVVTDLRGNTNEGDIVTVKFTIPKYKTETVTLVSYTAPSAVWDPALAYQQEIFDQDFGTFSGGSYGKTYTLTVQIPNSYYQIDFVCGLAIDRFGKPGSNITYSSQGRLISADNDGKAPVPQGFGQLSGKVFIDKDKDGKLDSGEGGILNVKIQLTGIDDRGRSITLTRYTESDGTYSFKGLRPGTYSIKEFQPTGYNDGAECIGTAGGLKSSNDIFSKILVSFDTDGTGYNFAEIKKY